MKTFSLKTSSDSPVLDKDKGRFLAMQGNHVWFQDDPIGWAAFSCNEQLQYYQRIYGGEIIEFSK